MALFAARPRKAPFTLKRESSIVYARVNAVASACGLVLFLMVSAAACTGSEQTAGTGGVSIADITSNPAEYEGKTVTLTGEYRGWEPGHGSPPVTRSDWVLKDESGAIYVSGRVSPGLDPVEDCGRELTVRGIIRVINNQAYLQAQLITESG